MAKNKQIEKERQIVEREFKAINAMLAGYPIEGGWQVRVYLAGADFQRPNIETELNRRVQEKFGKEVKVKVRKCNKPENEYIELQPPKQQR